MAERCDECGREHGQVFHVEEALWAKIAPCPEHGTGVLCIDCANRAAERLGTYIRWYGTASDEEWDRLVAADKGRPDSAKGDGRCRGCGGKLYHDDLCSDCRAEPTSEGETGGDDES